MECLFEGEKYGEVVKGIKWFGQTYGKGFYREGVLSWKVREEERKR